MYSPNANYQTNIYGPNPHYQQPQFQQPQFQNQVPQLQQPQFQHQASQFQQHQFQTEAPQEDVVPKPKTPRGTFSKKEGQRENQGCSNQTDTLDGRGASCASGCMVYDFKKQD